MTNLCLVLDVSNIVHRSYHSVATGKEGQSVIGLARHRLKSMTSTLLRDCPPLRLVGALDVGKSFRHDLFPAYKAHRGEKPVELQQLLDEAPGLLKWEFGVELYCAQGFEADDVLATVADQNLGAGWRTCLVTNDADALQLAHDAGNRAGTYILHHKDGAYHALGPEQVAAKMGVPPHRVALYKALAGDASDGLKGIEGIGPVAAKRLANAYPSARKIHDSLDRLQSSDRKKLESAGLDHLLLMERMTTLRFDVPLQAV